MVKNKKIKPSNCIICGPIEAVKVINGEFFNLPESDLVRCPECRLTWIDPVPSSPQIKTFYPQEYYGIQNQKFSYPLEAFIKLLWKQRIKKFTHSPSNSKRVLDIGCGRGLSLKILQKFDYEGYGIELSSFSAQKAASIPGLHIFSKPLMECKFKDNFFDLLLIWHVFEHLPNPLESIKEIFRILKPGGSLLLCVPNMASFQSKITGKYWFHLDLPRHLFHYTSCNINTLLRTNGFSITKQRTFSFEQGPFGLLQSFLNLLGFPHDSLYQMLHLTFKTKKISLACKLFQMELFFLTYPVMNLICYISSLLNQGAVIEILARKQNSSSNNRCLQREDIF